MAYRSLYRWLLAALLFCGTLGRAADPNAEALIVVYNQKDPTSEALAKYYAQRREIPPERVVGLNCPLVEEISRQEYETTIAQPLRKLFAKNKWWPGDIKPGIRFVALIRGIPLKIAPVAEGIAPAADQPPQIGGRNEASVDSELTCLALERRTPAGVQNNPYFRSQTPAVELDSKTQILLVSRLDALSDITVRVMIDSAISAERNGLWGWAYVDERNTQEVGYKMGDDWLKNAALIMRDKGIPVFVDHSPETLPSGFPLTDAAIYYGWYAGNMCGPFTDPDFRFTMGAIAVHIYSFSAATLRSPTATWCGPMLEKGAAASLGNCYEPNLVLTAQIDLFQDRLMGGMTLAESAWTSTRVLSWMSVVIGDPLYRPYAIWRNPAAMQDKQSDWIRYRNIVRSNRGVLLASGPLAEAARDTRNPMFLEALASAQADDGQIDAAMKSLKEAESLATNEAVRFRLVVEQIELMRRNGRVNVADGLLAKPMMSASGTAQQQLLRSIYLKIHPPTPTPKPSP